MSRLDDYLTALFLPDDEIAMREEIANAQQRELDRQRAEGNRGFFDYIQLSADIAAAGSEQKKFEEENDSPVKAVALSIPWWVYLALFVFVFFYFGGARLLRRS